MELILSAFCPGKVRGQGSLNFYGFRKNGTAIIRGTDEQYSWRDCVTEAIRSVMTPGQHARSIEKDVAVAVRYVFVYARPKLHYRTNGELRDAYASLYYNLSGSGIDIDKSERLCNDALTNSALIADDKQIAITRSEKIYVNEQYPEPGVYMEVFV